MTSIADVLFSRLATASVSSVAVAAGVWLACRFLPRLPPAARAALWWLVAVKLVVGLVWVAPVTVPILPAVSQAASNMSVPARAVTGAAIGRGAVAAIEPASALTGGHRLTWQAVLVLLWLAGLVVLAARFAWQLRQSLALRACAVPADADVVAVTRDAARRLGLSHVPDVCVSDAIAAPMLVGLRHPRIVVPRGRFAMLSAADQRMALCHELAHFRRGDLWLGLIPALAERLFFFHPVARLAAREYLTAREAACDAEAVAALGVSARDYAQLLLTLGVAPVPARFAAAGSSRTVSTLRRRIAMLGLPSPTRRTRVAGWALAAAALCAVVPVRLVGRAADVRVSADDTIAVSRAVPPVDVAAGVAPAPAGAAQAPEKGAVTRDRDRVEYALMNGESTMMSGSISSERLHSLRGSGARLLWFRVDGREYVVRDEATIARALEITRPIREIGAAQGEVGSRQGVIGAQQGEIGARQGGVGARQGAIGARQAELGARQAALAARAAVASDAQRQQLERQQAELDAEMRKLDEQMRALDAEMRRADEPMADLDAKMRVLDEEMRALDAKMHDAEPRVRADLRALFDRLVREKVAEPVN
jgi:beta-lactamase regulating signal transducer with metallopeptidase domain